MQYHSPPPPPRRRQGMSTGVIVLIVFAVLAVVALPVIGVVAALLLPVFAQAREAARTTACASNSKQMSLALRMYVQDYDNTLPPKARWADGLLEYAGGPGLYRCPTGDRDAGAPGNDFAYNSWLDGRRLDKVSDASQSPAIFESDAGAADDGSINITDDLKSFATRHGRAGRSGGHVIYVDGHVVLESSAPQARAGLGKSSSASPPSTYVPGTGRPGSRPPRLEFPDPPDFPQPERPDTQFRQPPEFTPPETEIPAPPQMPARPEFRRPEMRRPDFPRRPPGSRGAPPGSRGPGGAGPP